MSELFLDLTQFSIECIQIWSHNILYLESVQNMSKKNYSKCFKFGDCTKTCAWCRAAPPQLQAGDEEGFGALGASYMHKRDHSSRKCDQKGQKMTKNSHTMAIFEP